MAMDFPAPAAANDKFTDPASGKAYTYDGVAWKIDATATAPPVMDDYVLKAGDTMTGALTVQAAPASGGVAIRLPNATEAGHVAWLNGDGTRKAYLGAGATSDLDLNLDNADKLHVKGGSIFMGDGAGIHWGSTSAQSDVNNFSEGICMYGFGGTSQFGFNVTSGTLNASVQNTGNKFDVNIGGTTRQRTNSSGFTTYGNCTSTGPLIAQGTLAVTGATTLTGNVNIGGQTTVPVGNGGGINWGTGFECIRMHSNLTFTTSNRHDFWVGGGLRYYIGVSGGSNALLTRDTALKEFADKDNFVNTNQVLNYAVAEIKALKAEIAALKAQPKR